MKNNFYIEKKFKKIEEGKIMFKEKKKVVYIFGEKNLCNNIEKTIILYSLIKIYGLNFMKIRYLLSLIGIGLNCRFKKIVGYLYDILVLFLWKEWVLEDNLRQEYKKSIQRFLENQSIRGKLYKMKLPVRGQRTHSNAKTCKFFFLNLNLKKKNDE